MTTRIVSILTAGVIIFLSAGCQKPPETKQDVGKKEPQKISLQLQWVTQCQFAGYFVALEKGWYKDEGIDLTIYPGGPDIVPVDLVAARSRDFGTTLLADLASKIQKGKPVISIAQIQQDNGLRLLAKKNSKITQPEDFIGKKVGIWLGGWEVQFNALLAQKNIRPDRVSVISQGFSMRPFLEDQLDVASAMIYNEYEMVMAAGYSPEDLVVIDFDDYGLGFPGDVLFTSLALIREDPDLCLKMVKASMKGWQYALNHQNEAVSIVLAHDPTGVAKQDHQQKMMKAIAKLVMGTQKTKMGHLNSRVLSTMLHHLFEYKVIDHPISPDMIYTPRFIKEVVR